MEIAISEFKSKCIKVLKEASTSGEEFVVTLRGKPLARVIGVAPSRQRVLGGQKNALDDRVFDSILIHSDFENDWES